MAEMYVDTADLHSMVFPELYRIALTLAVGRPVRSEVGGEDGDGDGEAIVV